MTDTIEDAATRTLEGIQHEVQAVMASFDQEEPPMSDRNTITDGYTPLVVLVDMTQEAELLQNVDPEQLAEMTKQERKQAAETRAAEIVRDGLPVSRRRAVIMADVYGEPDPAGYDGRTGFNPNEIPSAFNTHATGEHQAVMGTVTRDNNVD